MKDDIKGIESKLMELEQEIQYDKLGKSFKKPNDLNGNIRNLANIVLGASVVFFLILNFYLFIEKNVIYPSNDYSRGIENVIPIFKQEIIGEKIELN